MTRKLFTVSVSADEFVERVLHTTCLSVYATCRRAALLRTRVASIHHTKVKPLITAADHFQ